jgi:hypothetical protein
MAASFIDLTMTFLQGIASLGCFIVLSQLDLAKSFMNYRIESRSFTQSHVVTEDEHVQGEGRVDSN